MITSPRSRWSEQAFLLFPGKLQKGSHFPWVRTTLGWQLHLTHCQLCDFLFEALFVKPVFVFDYSVCFLLNRILSIDFLNNGIDFVNNFQLIKYYCETVILPNFLFRILIFGVSDVLSMFIVTFCFFLSTKVQGFQTV